MTNTLALQLLSTVEQLIDSMQFQMEYRHVSAEEILAETFIALQGIQEELEEACKGL